MMLSAFSSQINLLSIMVLTAGFYMFNLAFRGKYIVIEIRDDAQDY